MPRTALKTIIKDDVGATLARLRALNRKARNSGSDPEKRHAYNHAILAKAREFARSDYARRYMRALGGDPNESDIAAFIHVLMRMSSRDDRRLRSRHGLALKYAGLQGATSKRLKNFLAKNGGYKGGAQKYRERAIRMSPEG